MPYVNHLGSQGGEAGGSGRPQRRPDGKEAEPVTGGGEECIVDSLGNRRRLERSTYVCSTAR